MSYPVNARRQHQPSNPGYAPAANPSAGMAMYNARVLGQDAYRPNSSPAPVNAAPYPNPSYPQAGYPYPAQQPAYPMPQPAYPMPQPAYPAQQPAYPMPQPAYPSQQATYPMQQNAYGVPQPSYPAQPQGNKLATTMSFLGAFSGIIASVVGFFKHSPAPQAQPVPSQSAPPVNPYAGVVLPERNQLSDEDFVTSLYVNLLGRQPDPAGFAGYVNALRNGADRHELFRIFMTSDEYRARQQAPAQPQPAPLPVPAPAPAPAPLPPVTMELVRSMAQEYVSAHPEIADQPSYVNVAAVAQLREGVIAMLNARGYRAGRVLGPDGKPYDQVIAFGNATDPDAKTYRVTAGGAAISEAITVGYCDTNIPWSDVH